MSSNLFVFLAEWWNYSDSFGIPFFSMIVNIFLPFLLFSLEFHCFFARIG